MYDALKHVQYDSQWMDNVLIRLHIPVFKTRPLWNNGQGVCEVRNTARPQRAVRNSPGVKMCLLIPASTGDPTLLKKKSLIPGWWQSLGNSDTCVTLQRWHLLCWDSELCSNPSDRSVVSCYCSIKWVNVLRLVSWVNLLNPFQRET